MLLVCYRNCLAWVSEEAVTGNRKACNYACRRLAPDPSYVLALISFFFAAAADAEPLSTDRPGVADPPNVVAPGTIQLEGGLRVARETEGDELPTNTITVPESLLRVGLLPPLELRISTDGFIDEERSGASDRSNGSDLEIGGRLRFFGQDGIRPAAGLTFELSFPIGSNAATSSGLDPSGNFLLEWNWSERFTLDANLELAAPTMGKENSHRAFRVAPALSLTISLGTHTAFFIEYYSAFVDQGVSDEHSIDGGFTWLATDDLQFDISAGAGLNAATPDFFVAAGAVWRFLLF